MFKVFKKASPTTPADRQLQQVIDILYPPHEIQVMNDVKVQIEYGADYNLEAALVDLEEGNNDAVTQQTIREVAGRLAKVRTLVEAYVELDKDAQYMIVDNLGRSEEVEYE